MRIQLCSRCTSDSECGPPDLQSTGCGRKKSPIWEANKFKVGEFSLPQPVEASPPTPSHGELFESLAPSAVLHNWCQFFVCLFEDVHFRKGELEEREKDL